MLTPALRDRLCKAYLLLSMSVCVIVSSVIVYQSIDRYPICHVGIEPREFAWALLPSCGVFLASSSSAALNRWARISWVTLLVVLVVMDQFNFLIEYDVWVGRGGPDSGTPPWKVYFGR
ncbi:hypothetical protein [Verrucomicrobium sp. BvORR106]|uniref:hypothetical protein n=1 Tax=Verrucomicrobium sp. BvORR106 TaxID=1403819 RepID=UPI002240E88E|nr:hypothetical protein [Verrucomicrobium sp. BvORR106]